MRQCDKCFEGIIYFSRWCPESVTWLVVNGRTEEVEEILQTAAKINKVKNYPKNILTLQPSTDTSICNSVPTISSYIDSSYRLNDGFDSHSVNGMSISGKSVSRGTGMDFEDSHVIRHASIRHNMGLFLTLLKSRKCRRYFFVVLYLG